MVHPTWPSDDLRVGPWRWGWTGKAALDPLIDHLHDDIQKSRPDGEAGHGGGQEQGFRGRCDATPDQLHQNELEAQGGE